MTDSQALDRAFARINDLIPLDREHLELRNELRQVICEYGNAVRESTYTSAKELYSWTRVPV